MPEPDYCFVVNPVAAGGRAARNWPQLQSKLQEANIAHRHVTSLRKGHCPELVRQALRSGYRNFIAVGGDGTASEVLNTLFAESIADRSQLSLGVVPWGTGNDWANYHGMSAAPDDCVKLLLAGTRTLQDIGIAVFTDATGKPANHYFLNCAGTGFDSYLLEQMGDTRGGRSRYLLYILKCLGKFRANSLKLDIQGELQQQQRTLLLETCIGKYAGAGMQFAPAAVADDGLFDILQIQELGALQLLASLLYLYNGRINQHRAAHHWRSPSVSIAAEQAQRFHCDGELVGTLPVRFEILPRALHVIAPLPAHWTQGSKFDAAVKS